MHISLYDYTYTDPPVADLAPRLKNLLPRITGSYRQSRLQTAILGFWPSSMNISSAAIHALYLVLCTILHYAFPLANFPQWWKLDDPSLHHRAIWGINISGLQEQYSSRPVFFSLHTIPRSTHSMSRSSRHYETAIGALVLGSFTPYRRLNPIKTEQEYVCK